MTRSPPKNQQRQCRDCTLCCKLPDIKSLNKPAGDWCANCHPSKGCNIYDSRPEECRAFLCGYRLNSDLGEHWFPKKARMIIRWDNPDNLIVVLVDPQRPNAWRQEPYYSQIKGWATQAAARNQAVLINCGGRAYVISPNQDIDLGEMKPGEGVAWTTSRRADGTIEYQARKTSPGAGFLPV